MINVAIRKLAGSDHESLAYARTFAGRATCFVYFQDDIWGAMVLYHFTDMLRAVFHNSPVKLTLVEQELSLKHPAVLGLLRQSPRNASAPPPGPAARGGQLPRAE